RQVGENLMVEIARSLNEQSARKHASRRQMDAQGEWGRRYYRLTGQVHRFFVDSRGDLAVQAGIEAANANARFDANLRGIEVVVRLCNIAAVDQGAAEQDRVRRKLRGIQKSQVFAQIQVAEARQTIHVPAAEVAAEFTALTARVDLRAPQLAACR